jgi:hypothetical protein
MTQGKGRTAVNYTRGAMEECPKLYNSPSDYFRWNSVAVIKGMWQTSIKVLESVCLGAKVC